MKTKTLTPEKTSERTHAVPGREQSEKEQQSAWRPGQQPASGRHETGRPGSTRFEEKEEEEEGVEKGQ